MARIPLTEKSVSTPSLNAHFLITQPELPASYTPSGEETEEELEDLKIESVRRITAENIIEFIKMHGGLTTAALDLIYQRCLTFDNTPTEKSQNPVYSGGVKAAIDEVAAASELADLKAEDARTAMSIFLQAWRILKEEVDTHLTEHDEEFSAETGVVVLHNTNTAHMLFNDSGQTIALEKVRNTMNYDLDTDVIDVSGGQLADVIVYDKQLNGFKMRFEGSASSVSVKYKVRGGMYA